MLNNNQILSIVVPTYNEVENLEEFVETANSLLSDFDYEVIIVDDNSVDGTGELAELLSKRYGNMRIIHRAKKMGSASAVTEGIKIARGNIVATLNADFQHPVEFLPVMLRKIGEFDIVIGSRYVKGGGIEEWSRGRFILSMTGTFLAHIFIHKIKRIKDPLSGFFVLKQSVIENIRIRPVGFKCLLEILARGSYDKIIEVPYVFKKRLKGRSKISFKDGITYLCHLFYLSWKS